MPISKKGKHYVVGRFFGLAIGKVTDLFYQHGTTHRFLCGLIDSLERSRRKRAKLMKEVE